MRLPLWVHSDSCRSLCSRQFFGGLLHRILLGRQLSPQGPHGAPRGLTGTFNTDPPIQVHVNVPLVLLSSRSPSHPRPLCFSPASCWVQEPLIDAATRGLFNDLVWFMSGHTHRAQKQVLAVLWGAAHAPEEEWAQGMRFLHSTAVFPREVFEDRAPFREVLEAAVQCAHAAQEQLPAIRASPSSHLQLKDPVVSASRVLVFAGLCDRWFPDVACDVVQAAHTMAADLTATFCAVLSDLTEDEGCRSRCVVALWGLAVQFLDTLATAARAPAVAAQFEAAVREGLDAFFARLRKDLVAAFEDATLAVDAALRRSDPPELEGRSGREPALRGGITLARMRHEGKRRAARGDQDPPACGSGLPSRLTLRSRLVLKATASAGNGAPPPPTASGLHGPGGSGAECARCISHCLARLKEFDAACAALSEGLVRGSEGEATVCERLLERFWHEETAQVHAALYTAPDQGLLLELKAKFAHELSAADLDARQLHGAWALAKELRVLDAYETDGEVFEGICCVVENRLNQLKFKALDTLDASGLAFWLHTATTGLGERQGFAEMVRARLDTELSVRRQEMDRLVMGPSAAAAVVTLMAALRRLQEAADLHDSVPQVLRTMGDSVQDLQQQLAGKVMAMAHPITEDSTDFIASRQILSTLEHVSGLFHSDLQRDILNVVHDKQQVLQAQLRKMSLPHMQSCAVDVGSPSVEWVWVEDQSPKEGSQGQ